MTRANVGVARKRFGQHFLEPAWIDKVVRAIDPRPGETFIEVGPGRGALTYPLAARADAVLAFEIDRDLAAALRDAAPGNVTVIEGDFLEAAQDSRSTIDRRLPATDSFRVAGNLPYNVASPILFKLAQMYAHGVRLKDATVMLQREVADRLLADPGSREYGVLSILIRHSATAERLMNLPRGAFRPVPKVQSSLIRLSFHAPDPAVQDPALFGDLVQAVFTRRRKTLANALEAFARGGGSRLPGWLDGRRRPETLSIAEFARLADDLSNKS